MGYLKYVKQVWLKPRENPLWKERLIQWRTEPVTLRIDHPTRIDRARSLGFKAKPGYIVLRQRVLRGGRQRPKFKAGRRPKHYRRRKIVSKSYQQVAEERSVKKYPNLEVLSSYWVGQDGNYYWYEIILVDKQSPSIRADKRISWIAERQHTRRVFRGLTSSAKKSRGLRRKGIGAEKIRPSLRANLRKAH